MRNTMLKKYIFITLILMYVPSAHAIVAGSPHDLSPAKDGTKACQYCHTPHRALSNTPLWNHQLSNAVYTIYSSSSLDAKVGQPTGSSKLCLSCHDGTIALESSVNNPGGKTFIQPGTTNLGTDLSDDHPVSFVYSGDLSSKDRQLKNPDSLPTEIKLDELNELQCSTCHDPHDNTFGNFLVTTNINSNLCVQCHDLKHWPTSIHATSNVSVQNVTDPVIKNSKYNTVAENGCNSCHQPHSAGGAERLLHYDAEENNCLNCHSGQAGTNVANEFQKLSGHFVSNYKGVHDIKEQISGPEKHVECADCHNPHAIVQSPANPPFVSGALKGVTGVSAEGNEIENSIYEYEVCYKCHGINSHYETAVIPRKITQTNCILEFDQSNPSYHPITFRGVNTNVPSLYGGLDESSVITCTSCHNSDSTSQVKGPHGSIYPYLLAHRYDTEDGTVESPSTYELCYTCHDRQSILGNKSFPEHSRHIVDQKTPCSACHDPHGISFSQGNSINNSHLMNFDVSIVSPDPVTGRLDYEDLGTFKGQCYLQCHGNVHSPKEYTNTP